jgi:hypothetical protein
MFVVCDYFNDLYIFNILVETQDHIIYDTMCYKYNNEYITKYAFPIILRKDDIIIFHIVDTVDEAKYIVDMMENSEKYNL